MKLFERDGYLDRLSNQYKQIKDGNGHTIFLLGEAGIGKTSLVNHFTSLLSEEAVVFVGSCDSLFTPRPLGPLLDIAGQLGDDFIDTLKGEKDRSLIFAAFLKKLSDIGLPVVLIFEDIHWADEATFDLIKFLARRVSRFKCLFLVTYRDDEIHAKHPLNTIFGELSPEFYSKLPVTRLSREAVSNLAIEKGYPSAKQLFELTGGNPFYVMEILANNNQQIPDRVKDSVLAVFYSKSDRTRALLETLSVVPSRIEFALAKQLGNDFPAEIEACLAAGIIVARHDYLAFKHELYRMTIEESLSPFKRRDLNRRILDIMLNHPDDYKNLSQFVHHAKYAEDMETVARMAPLAAREAATIGAHIEAAKLYGLAIEATDKKNPELANLYERHAYECYLIYEAYTAIASQQQALDLWRQRNVRLREGDTLRFLSRLWWLAGNPTNAMTFALQSIEVLENGFPTPERAMAYSNLSQLYMLSHDAANALLWGNKAIELSTKMKDQSILCHALINVGSTMIRDPVTEKEGEEKLRESLRIALENGFHEHVARTYGNLSASYVYRDQYKKAMDLFEVGLKYCEERDLSQYRYYMQNHKVRALFELGKWEEAEGLGYSLQASLTRPGIVTIDSTTSLAKLQMRRGNFDESKTLLLDAKSRAMPTQEAQRIIPVLTGELELAWLGKGDISLNEIRAAEKTLFSTKNNSGYYTNLAYWMRKCGIPEADDQVITYCGPFQAEQEGNWKLAAESWKKIGRPYEQALALFEGDETHQKEALLILDKLGASATYDKLKSELVRQGVKNIPRGPQQSTRNNPAQLTSRQIEILGLLDEGLQNKQIAEKLFISPKTVDNHISAIFSQLDVNSRAKAVLAARKLGILKS